jgi:hypothetical protein
VTSWAGVGVGVARNTCAQDTTNETCDPNSHPDSENEDAKWSRVSSSGA